MIVADNNLIVGFVLARDEPIHVFQNLIFNHG